MSFLTITDKQQDHAFEPIQGRVKSIGQLNAGQEVNATGEDLINRLSHNVLSYLFQFLNLTDLAKASLVSKNWNMIVAKDIVWKAVAHQIDCPLQVESGVPCLKQTRDFIRNLQSLAQGTAGKLPDITKLVNIHGPTIEDLSEIQKLLIARDTLLVWECLALCANNQIAGANLVRPGLENLGTANEILDKAAKFSGWFFENRDTLVLLTNLNLNQCQLTSLPNELWNLSNVETLWLAGNQLSELPNELIRKLKNLIELGCSYNKFNLLPMEICKLKHLRKLYLGNNRIKELPDEISNLSNLTELHLENNNLSSLPPGIGKLLGLEHLNLNNNQLTSLPDKIKDLPNLKFLGLQFNPLPLSTRGITSLKNNKSTIIKSALGGLISSIGGYLINEYMFRFTDQNFLSSIPSILMAPMLFPLAMSVNYNPKKFMIISTALATIAICSVALYADGTEKIPIYQLYTYLRG